MIIDMIRFETTIFFSTISQVDGRKKYGTISKDRGLFCPLQNIIFYFGIGTANTME